jgi:hypothetical protein
MKLRFSMRDLGWLALVVALLLGWMIDHLRLAPRYRFTVESVLSNGEPAVLKDNETGQILVKRDGFNWRPGKNPSQVANSAP